MRSLVIYFGCLTLWYQTSVITLSMQETKLSTICERVFDRCLAPVAGAEGCDNMTMILVQFKKPFKVGASVGDQLSACYQTPSQDEASPHDQPSKPVRSAAETESQSRSERNHTRAE